MRKYLLSILLAVTLFTALSSNELQKFVVRLENPSQKDIAYFSGEKFDIASYKKNSYIDLVVTKKVYDALSQKGYNLKITQTESEIKSNLNSKNIDGYRTYQDMLSELQTIATEHPDICQLYDIGDSWGKIYSEEGYSFYDNYNHDIWALKISDNPSQEEDEPNIYYIGEHHAREPISMEMVMKIIEHLVNGYGNDTEITQNINNKQIWCVPLLNPNGHKIVIEQTDVWWRKNIRDNNEDHQFSNQENNNNGPDGVDPNRNYGFQWGDVGASDNVNDQTYHGPEPFSEPNIQAIKALIDAHKFVAGISYHSYSEAVLYPLGYANNTVAPDHDALADLATSMANAIPGINSAHYTPEQSWELYPCMGTSDDYFYGQDRAFAYTIELGTQFIPPANTMNQICDNNIQAAMILLNRSDNRILTGHITDAVSGNPIQAQIHIDGIDDSDIFVYPTTSDTAFGRYYRLLLPGNYTVTYSKFGYQSQTQTVTIDANQQTVLDIQLQSIGNSFEFSGFVRDANTSEIIQNAKVEILNTPLDPVFTNQNGEFSFPQVYENSYQIKISADGFNTYLHNVSLSSEEAFFPIFLNPISGESFENSIPDSWSSQITQNDWHIDSSHGFDGTHSLASNDISDNQTASFIYQTENLENDSFGSFYYKVSSEPSYDFLKFYIDDQLTGSWSGNIDWTYFQYQVSSGIHSLKWIYSKDQAVSNGDDCGYIDLVLMPDKIVGGNLIVFPSNYDFSIPQNSTLDTTLVLFNNTRNIVNAELSNSANWIDFFDTQTSYNIEVSMPKVVGFTVSSGNEDTTLETTIAVNYGENQTLEIPITVHVGQTGNEDSGNNITQTILKNSYPNPFIANYNRASVKIAYHLAKSTKVNLSIFNIKGQLVKTIVNQKQNPGNYNILWDTKDNGGNPISSGIYFYKLQTKNHVFVKKMTVLK